MNNDCDGFVLCPEISATLNTAAGTTELQHLLIGGREADGRVDPCQATIPGCKYHELSGVGAFANSSQADGQTP